MAPELRRRRRPLGSRGSVTERRAERARIAPSVTKSLNESRRLASFFPHSGFRFGSPLRVAPTRRVPPPSALPPQKSRLRREGPTAPDPPERIRSGSAQPVPAAAPPNAPGGPAAPPDRRRYRTDPERGAVLSLTKIAARTDRRTGDKRRPPPGAPRTDGPGPLGTPERTRNSRSRADARPQPGAIAASAINETRRYRTDSGTRRDRSELP